MRRRPGLLLSITLASLPHYMSSPADALCASSLCFCEFEQSQGRRFISYAYARPTEYHQNRDGVGWHTVVNIAALVMIQPLMRRGVSWLSDDELPALGRGGLKLQRNVKAGLLCGSLPEKLDATTPQ